MKRSAPHMVAILAATGLLCRSHRGVPFRYTPEPNGTARVQSSLPGRAPVAGSTPTLRLGGGQAGHGWLQPLQRARQRHGSALQVGARAASTLMACPPAVPPQTETFWDALTGARSYRVESGQLQLLSGSGAVLATLRLAVGVAGRDLVARDRIRQRQAGGSGERAGRHDHHNGVLG